jgi:catalase
MTPGLSSDEQPLGDRLVDAVNRAAGVHPGHRALHAKGIGATGTFTATGEATAITTAAHLQAGSVPVTVRFSNGSGNPDQADGARDGRGFAVRFHLLDGSNTDLVTLSLPVFFVRTVDDFLAFTAARVPDPATGQPDLNRILAFLGEHPEAQPAAELSIAAEAPASYTSIPYHGVHAFWFIDADGRRQAIKYRWEPDAGVATIPDDRAADLDPGYLGAELRSRLAESSASFTLHIVAGADDDPTDDPTAAWPDDRPSIVAGQLTLEDVADDQATVDSLIFDPTRTTAGIECTDDPILLARAEAYGTSYSRRQG